VEIKMKSINEKILKLEIFNSEEPRRVNNKWPTIIFAVRWIDNVNGRIIKLIDSIITINGISIKGVSDGIKLG